MRGYSAGASNDKGPRNYFVDHAPKAMPERHTWRPNLGYDSLKSIITGVERNQFVLKPT
jgi:hypothetical protein